MTNETALPLSFEADAAGARLFLLKSAEEQIARALESRTRELSENGNLGEDADRLIRHIASLTLSLARLTKLIEPPTDNPRHATRAASCPSPATKGGRGEQTVDPCADIHVDPRPSPPTGGHGAAPPSIGEKGRGTRAAAGGASPSGQASPAGGRALSSGERSPASRDLEQTAVSIDPRYSAERRAALGAMRGG